VAVKQRKKVKKSDKCLRTMANEGYKNRQQAILKRI
jgi:hypothetical protein